MSAAIDIAIPMVKEFEGLRLTSYLCPAGKETIGYGHTGNDVCDGMNITEAQADSLLYNDLYDAEQDVNDLVRVDLKDCERAALISFVFNLGGHALEESTLLRELNEGNRKNVLANFMMWCKYRPKGSTVKVVSPGLARRRKAEAMLFATGDWKCLIHS